MKANFFKIGGVYEYTCAAPIDAQRFEGGMFVGYEYLGHGTKIVIQQVYADSDSMCTIDFYTPDGSDLSIDFGDCDPTLYFKEL